MGRFVAKPVIWLISLKCQYGVSGLGLHQVRMREQFWRALPPESICAHFGRIWRPTEPSFGRLETICGARESK